MQSVLEVGVTIFSQVLFTQVDVPVMNVHFSGVESPFFKASQIVFFIVSLPPVGVYELQFPKTTQVAPFQPHFPDTWLSHDD